MLGAAAVPPNWTEIWTTIFTGVVALGVVLGGFQLRDSRRGRNGEIARDLARRWDSREMVGARRLVIQLTSGRSPDDAVKGLIEAMQVSRATEGDLRYYTFVRYMNFFEEIGLLWRYQSVSIRMVDAILGTTIRTNWRLCEPVLQAVWGRGTKGCENFRRIALKLERRAEWKVVRVTMKEILLLKPPAR